MLIKDAPRVLLEGAPGLLLEDAPRLLSKEALGMLCKDVVEWLHGGVSSTLPVVHVGCGQVYVRSCPASCMP